MMTRLTLTVLAAVLFGLAATAQDAEEKKPELKEQTVCPVMGGKINKSSFVDHEGQRIYVCCAGCIAPLKKEPAKYIKKLAEKGEAPAKLQTTCPVMEGKINKDLYVDHDGKRIYVCCEGCIAAVQKDPEKYTKKLETDGVTLDPAGKAEEKEESHSGHDEHKGHH